MMVGLMRAVGRAAILFVLLAVPPAMAQSVPEGLLDQPRPSDLLPPLPKPEPPKPRLEFQLPPVAPPTEEAPLSAGPRFLLNSVGFEGNRVFTDQELGAVAALFLDRVVSAEDLENLRRLLTLHYVEAGYINSGAVLPDQQVVDGTVAFRIVEGVLSKVTVIGNERMPSSYIEDRIRLSAGPPLNVNPLQERLRLLLEDPLIERIDAELGPGVQPGEAELTITVVEAPAVGLIVGVDNFRVPSVGAEEVRGTILLRDLAGQGEIIAINPSKTAGLTQVDIRGEVPVTAHDTRLIGHMEYGVSQVIEGDFSSLDIEGETFEANFGLRQRIYRTPGQELALSLTFNWRRSLTFLDGERFSFSPGVDDGKSVVSVFRGTVDWVERSQNRVIAARSTFSGGVDILGATTNPGSIPDGQFFSWLGQAQMVQRFDPYDLRLVLRGETQLTPDRLLPLEKCAIGGIDTVRGYRKDFLVRDNCWAASAELRIPILNLSLPSVPANLEDGRVDFAPFFDAGQAWDSDIDAPGPKTLMSVGAGLRWAPMRGVLATLYYGYQIKDVDDPDDTDLQDHGILLSLEVAVF